jgi:hypothetical protein
MSLAGMGVASGNYNSSLCGSCCVTPERFTCVPSCCAPVATCCMATIEGTSQPAPQTSPASPSPTNTAPNPTPIDQTPPAELKPSA